MRSLLLTASLIAPFLVLAGTCHAFERQWHAGADLGIASLASQDEWLAGYGAGAHLAYGLTDAYNLMLEVHHSHHAGDDSTPGAGVSSAGLGVAYTLDVVSWVPYLGLLLGGYRFESADESRYDVGLQGALGLDYRWARSWAVGAQLRYHTVSDAPFDTHYVTTAIRLETTWGW